MERLRSALADIAAMRHDGLLTDEEARPRDRPAPRPGPLLINACALSFFDHACDYLQAAELKAAELATMRQTQQTGKQTVRQWCSACTPPYHVLRIVRKRKLCA